MAKMALAHMLHSLCFLTYLWFISLILRIKLLPDLFLPINQNIIMVNYKSDRNLIMFSGAIKELAASDYVTQQLPELFK